MDAKTTLPRKTALVTGASVGIGYELSRQFARASYDLVLVARNKERLEDVSKELESAFGVRAAVFQCDLADRQGPDKIFEAMQKHGVRIDVLVNNAGFGTHGAFHANDLRRELDMVQVNIAALVHLTRLFLPAMVETRNGKILNVASTAAFQPGPLMAVYFATKAFGLSFSEALATELAGTGVSVTALCPGPTFTEFQKRAGIEHTKLFGRGMIMNAREVAIAGYQGLMEGKRVVVPGIKNKALAFSTRFVPRRLSASVAHSLNSNR